jgi:hypothetical protein
LTVREYFKDGNTTEKSMQRQMNFGKGWNGIGILKGEKRYTGMVSQLWLGNEF